MLRLLKNFGSLFLDTVGEYSFYLFIYFFMCSPWFMPKKYSLFLFQMEMNTLKDMVLGKPAPLVSTFRLSYYSILNLMSRAEGQFTAEHVIKNSFHQFQYEKVSAYSIMLLLFWHLQSSCSMPGYNDYCRLPGLAQHWTKSSKTGRRSCKSRCLWGGNCFFFFLFF